MKRFLLDTNAWIAFLNGHQGMAAHIRRAGLPSLSLCAPVWAELWFGACKSQRVAENQSRLREMAACIASLPFDDEAAEHCADIRYVLSREGRVIGPYDMQIAAIARTNGLCAVTRNVAEFNRVPGLLLENWQEMP